MANCLHRRRGIPEKVSCSGFVRSFPSSSCCLGAFCMSHPDSASNDFWLLSALVFRGDRQKRARKNVAGAVAAMRPSLVDSAAGPRSSDGRPSLQGDLAHLVLSYAGLADLCAAQCCSKDLREVARRDDLWLRQLEVSGVLLPAQFDAAARYLGLHSYLQLAEALHGVGIPDGIVGYWRGIVEDRPTLPAAAADGPFPDSVVRACEACREHIQGPTVDPWRGELLRITAMPSGFLCQAIDPDGMRRAVFRVRVSAANPDGPVSIKFFPLERSFPGGGGWPGPAGFGDAAASDDVSPPSPGGDSLCSSRGVVLRRTGASAFMLLRGSTMRKFVKLPAMPGSCLPHPVPTTASAALAGAAGNSPLRQRLAGIWMAAYGGHGMQIVQTSMRVASPAGASAATAAAADVDSPLAGGGPRLWGVKVVGDPNVPAGRCSFVVNLARAYHPDEELMQDPRLVVSFPTSGAVVADLAARRASIDTWYKGLGQINRLPGVWKPEWVEIDFIVYGEGATAFSVVWSEPGEAIRVMVDAIPL
ncbi:unnamed protein product, partial [Phaeothamnion confervicola]